MTLKQNDSVESSFGTENMKRILIVCQIEYFSGDLDFCLMNLSGKLCNNSKICHMLLFVKVQNTYWTAFNWRLPKRTWIIKLPYKLLL